MTQRFHVPRCDHCEEPITEAEDLRARWYLVTDRAGRVVARLSMRFCRRCRETAPGRGMTEAAAAAQYGAPGR